MWKENIQDAYAELILCQAQIEKEKEKMQWHQPSPFPLSFGTFIKTLTTYEAPGDLLFMLSYVMGRA